MDISKWDPLKDVFHKRFYTTWDDFFPVPRNEKFNPAVDIYETTDKIIIKVEIPGVDKDKISIDLIDQKLIIKGERSITTEDESDHYYKKEIIYGSFERSFKIPINVKFDDIIAEYHDGILKINIPKPDVVKPKKIKIQ